MNREKKKEKTEIILDEGRRELKRLLIWIAENHDDWEHICDPEFFSLSVRERLELIERLEQAGLHSIAYVVLYAAGERSREMEVVRNQIIHEILADIPAEVLMERIKNVMKTMQEVQENTRI